jgi:uridylate kinase
MIAGVNSGKIVVLGGFNPGQSTNAVASIVAEKTRAKMLVNATDVDAVYSKDPRRYRSARRLAKVSVEELGRLLWDKDAAAGTYELMDPVALKILMRSRIPAIITKCDKVSIIKAVRKGRGGTLVTHGSRR